MKTAIAMTTLKRIYDNLFSAGYCDLYKIMKCTGPAFYNAGVYGWNCDIYTLYDFQTHQSVAISTGYRNMRSPTIPQRIIDKYNAEADAIEEKYSGQYGAAAYEAMCAEYDAMRERLAAELLAG